MNKKIVCLILLMGISLCILTPPAWSAEGYWGRSGQKLGRGLTNIVFSFVEIPKAMEDAIQKDEPFKLILVNPLRGVVSMVGRILVGTYEVATFWVPQKPILKPAYVVPNIKEYLKQKDEEMSDGPTG